MDPVLAAALGALGIRLGTVAINDIALPVAADLLKWIGDTLRAQLHAPTLLAVIAGTVRGQAADGAYEHPEALYEAQLEATRVVIRNAGGGDLADEEARAILQAAFLKNRALDQPLG